MKKTRKSLSALAGSKQLSLLPEPDFNPIYPSPHTLPARCLSLMLNGEALTHPEFEEETGSWRLAAVIFTLRGLGWPVESHELPAPTSDVPTRFISSYFLSPKVIRAIFGGGQ